MPLVRARIFALLAAVIMLLPSGAPARSQYYCRMMGRIVASSACDEAASRAVGPAPELQLADCCQRLTSSSRNAALGTLDAPPGIAPPALVATAPQLFPVRFQGGAAVSFAEATQSPLAIGPPLFIAHCALLS